MGTTWAVACDDATLVDGAIAQVHDAERRLSRFLPTSALSRCNRDRFVRDELLAAVVGVALALRDGTDGAFDPGVGDALCALGYDRPLGEVRAATPRPGRPVALRVSVDGDAVTLAGEGTLDLGGVAKGFVADRVAEGLVRRGAGPVLVDGGGDLRACGGAFPVGVGDRRAVLLRDRAVATSSTRHRAWSTRDGRRVHHVVDPRTGGPGGRALDTATVVAPSAAVADALATALLVDPERLVPRLPSFGAAALVRSVDGSWWATADWEDA